jgi:4'-phosphopantetheinyl transferase
MLNSEELQRRERYVRAEDRDRFTLGAVLLRLAAAAHTERAPERILVTRTCAHCTMPHGRPVLPQDPLEASVSHSGDLVVVALSSGGAVGVDIEHITSRLAYRAMLSTVCVPAEAIAVRRLDDFFRYWTRKEAVLKATGVGLREGMRRVVVTEPWKQAGVLSYDGKTAPDIWMSDLTVAPRYAAAVAVFAAGPVDLVVQSQATALLGAAPPRPGE